MFKILLSILITHLVVGSVFAAFQEEAVKAATARVRKISSHVAAATAKAAKAKNLRKLDAANPGMWVAQTEYNGGVCGGFPAGIIAFKAGWCQQMWNSDHTFVTGNLAFTCDMDNQVTTTTLFDAADTMCMGTPTFSMNNDPGQCSSSAGYSTSYHCAADGTYFRDNWKDQTALINFDSQMDASTNNLAASNYWASLGPINLVDGLAKKQRKECNMDITPDGVCVDTREVKSLSYVATGFDKGQVNMYKKGQGAGWTSSIDYQITMPIQDEDKWNDLRYLTGDWYAMYWSSR